MRLICNKISIDPRQRWGVEFKAVGSRTWMLLGTLGSHREAERWLIRFHGSGDYRVRHPNKGDA